MKYEQIKPKKIYEQVADILLERIRSGELKPGDQLASVQQLAENFSVGRSAVREALTSLRAMGLIEMRQGEGTFVKEFSSEDAAFPLHSALLMNEQDVAHLFEVRKILEAGAVSNAAKHRTAGHLEKMAEALAAMKQHAGDIVLGEKADLDFHFAIAEASANPLLVAMMNHVAGLISESMRETRRICLFTETATVDRLYEEHEAILSAIERQDESGAQTAMYNHLTNVENVLFNYMQSVND